MSYRGPVDLSHRIASANSLPELALHLSGDPRTRLEVREVFQQLDLRAEELRALAETRGVLGLTLLDYLKARDLHRSSGVPYAQLLKAFKEWLAMPSGPLGLADVESFTELAEVMPPGLSALRLGTILGVLDLNPKLRKSLLVDAQRTVGEFLDRAEDKPWSDTQYFSVLDALKAWLATERPSFQLRAQKPPPAPKGPSREELEARLQRLEIPDLLSWPAEALDPSSVYPSVQSWLHTTQTGRALQLIEQFEARLRQLRAAARPTPRLIEGVVAPIQAAALAARTSLEKSYPLGISKGDVRVLVHEDRVTFDVHAWPREYNTRVATDGTLARWVENGAPLVCSCHASRLPVCLHRVLVYEVLAFGGLDSPSAQARFAEAMTPPWKRLLATLAEEPRAEKKPKPAVLSFHLYGDGIEVHLHEVGKKGPAAKGRHVSSADALARVDGVDQRIAERVAVAVASRFRGSRENGGDAVRALIGHPRVYWDNDTEPSPVHAAQIRIHIDDQEKGFGLRLSIDERALNFEELRFFDSASGGVVVSRGEDGTIHVAPFPPALRRVAAAMEKFGNHLPKEAAPQLVELLPKLEGTAVVELPEQLRGEEVAPRTAPLVQVSGGGDGLVLAVRAEPLERGPVFVPGQGVPVSATFDGHRRTFTRRALEREVHEATALAEQLGLDVNAAESAWTWHLDGSERHVETLRRLSQSSVPVEWKAPKVKFTSEAKLGSLRLSVERQKDWFGLDGEVKVDGRRVSLAALLEAARARRRFVQLAPGEFAQLSEELVQSLAPLAHLAAPGKTPELTLGTAPLLEALEPQLEALEAAKEWKALMERLATSQRATFPVPKGLKASLRDYQVEGFQWLSRLAEWGVGAVLADDMGLGKTLQALTLLLSRAKKGPAIVVAPSSVLHTWRTEAEKFAPSLKLSLFHEGARELGALGPGDVLVVSWTLLGRNAEAFSKVRFATVVLDEAHAIKNAGTQRAKAAHELDAEFIVALSGTPVENHVGELWSLFKAVMPQLLGSEESFRRRFGAGDRNALAALATVVRPFILRRTKDTVAKELPPRTDLELVVPLSAEERALYDDVRLTALGQLGEVTGESKRFDVLAALTRLRLTACHPRLVDASWKGPASKLSRLLELVKDLIAGKHKVLVFSQFTKHLALVVEALRDEGIVFSYLDGEVAVSERQKRVEAFQRGQGGDVFLISLKAGGTGLTLTEANYVIHLDPWWNPAVEDQASDRAHRLGQSKPVTVYRLIAEGTIEQQILSLHADKRELVDALLAGSETAGKLSTTQLAEMIRGA